MAILNKIEVTIQVDGKDLKEYEDPDTSEQTPNKVTKYIEPVSEARFTIRFHIAKPYKMTSPALSFNWSTDKLIGRSIVMTKKNLQDCTNAWIAIVQGLKVDTKTGCEIRPFVFSKINAGKQSP